MAVSHIPLRMFSAKLAMTFGLLDQKHTVLSALSVHNPNPLRTKNNKRQRHLFSTSYAERTKTERVVYCSDGGKVDAS